MAGLLTQQQTSTGAGPAAPPIPGAGPAAPAQAGGEEQPNVTPEEQQLYDTFVDNAFSAIYDDKSLPRIIESLAGDGNPVDGLANTAVSVVARVEDSAEKAGQVIPPDVVFSAGVEIIENLADLAEKAGVHVFTPEELEGATFQAMDLYREMKGRDGGAARPQIVDDFNKIVELDQAGRLDEVAPGLSDRFGGAAQGGPANG